MEPCPRCLGEGRESEAEFYTPVDDEGYVGNPGWYYPECAECDGSGEVESDTVEVSSEELADLLAFLGDD